MALIYCTECGRQISDRAEYCPGCGCPVSADIDHAYTTDFWGREVMVVCPRCNSDNCSDISETFITPGKTKTSYTMNLNPFKPFTLMNKKEKVVKKEKSRTITKFQCNNCGKVFY